MISIFLILLFLLLNLNKCNKQFYVDVRVVGSCFLKQGILGCKNPDEKCVSFPYGKFCLEQKGETGDYDGRGCKEGASFYHICTRPLVSGDYTIKLRYKYYFTKSNNVPNLITIKKKDFETHYNPVSVYSS